MNKIGLQNARVYFTGSNLFCIDGYSGIDPDVNTKTDGKDGFPTPYLITSLILRLELIPLVLI